MAPTLAELAPPARFTRQFCNQPGDVGDIDVSIGLVGTLEGTR
ncbi:MAG TPA: hypothetical protein VHD63_17420 [Ktedonobacteraceae bacterium]|nr:hypothetical protein [Ktedonobacteraceae bacterium]